LAVGELTNICEKQQQKCYFSEGPFSILENETDAIGVFGHQFFEYPWHGHVMPRIFSCPQFHVQVTRETYSVSLAGPEEHVDILVASHGNVHAEENQQNEPNW